MEGRKTGVLTKRQAAEALGVTTRTVDSWRARGVDMGVLFTPTGRVRFSAGAIEKLLRPRRPRVAPTANGPDV